MAYHIDPVGFPNIPLTPGMVLKLEARDPNSDAAITGVTCTLWAIYGDDLSGVPLTDVVPLYTALEIGNPP